MAQTKTGRTTSKGTPQKKATSVKEWKKTSVRQPVFLELPSGHVCKAINKGLDVFRQEGLIPNGLLPIVTRALERAEGMKPSEAQDVVKDPKILGQVLELADAVVVSCVVDPVIVPALTAEIPGKEPNSVVTVTVEPGQSVIDVHGNVIERDEETLYVDELDLDDKMFVFQWAVGGVKDIEKFREQSAGAMANIQGGE